MSTPCPCPYLPQPSENSFRSWHLANSGRGDRGVMGVVPCPRRSLVYACVLAEATTQGPSAVLGRGAGRSFPKTGGRCLASLLSPLPRTCSWLPPAPVPGLSQGPSPPPTSPSSPGSSARDWVSQEVPPLPQACLSSLPSLCLSQPSPRVFSLTATWITTLFGSPRCSPSVALKSSCTQFRYGGSPVQLVPLAKGTSGSRPVR